MKTRFALLLSLALLAGFTAAQAQTAYVNIDTPTAHHVFTGCTLSDVFVDRLGTVVTIYADCSTQSSSPQIKGWQPIDHPDGGVLWWDSRLRLTAFDVFEQCTLIDYGRTSGLELVTAQCLDDPTPLLQNARSLRR